MLNNFDAGYVFRHPVFLVTFVLALPAWIISFAAQIAAEANYSTSDGTPVVKYLWYSIWLQLAAIIHLFLALCTDQLALHRFQLAVVLAIAEVFAVYGTEFIFSKLGALIAVGVASLILAIVDLVWIIYLTSEENSFFYRILTAGGTGGLSGLSRRSARRESGAAFASGENGLGEGLSGGMSGGYGGTPRLNNGTFSMGAGSMVAYAPAATETTPQKATIDRDAFGSHSPTGSEERYKHRAKAMYAYNASPDDPNEVSFAKGDVLEVMDNTGKWYQVRTPSGQTGIAPSNYLTML